MSAPATNRIGHVHLRVSDLDRAITVYRDIIGFRVAQRFGKGAAFLAAGDYHHHIGLNTWESLGATPPPAGHTGLYHTTFLYPDRASLGAVIAQAQAADIPLEGAADHGVSEAVYLRDPDQNGVDLYTDKPVAAWPHDANGQLQMVNAPLVVAALAALAADLPSQN